MTYKYELNQYQYKQNIRRNLSDAHQVDSTWLHCFHVFPMGNTHSKTKSNWIILQIDVAWSLYYIWLIWHTIQIDDTLPAGDFQVTHDEQTFQKKRTRCKFIEYFDFHMFDFLCLNTGNKSTLNIQSFQSSTKLGCFFISDGWMLMMLHNSISFLRTVPKKHPTPLAELLPPPHPPDNYGRAWHHGFEVHDHRYIVPLRGTKTWTNVNQEIENLHLFIY